MRIGSYGYVKDHPTRADKSDWVIYHNPLCSKSCQALDLLRMNGIDARVVEYLHTPLKRRDLEHLLTLLKVKAKAILRTSDALVEKLSIDVNSDDAVLDAIAENPSLLERPIIVHGGNAVIGRPAEKVLELL